MPYVTLGDAEADANAVDHDVTVRMQNGDPSAYLEALRSGKPALVAYAAQLVAARTGWPGGVHTTPVLGWSSDGKEVGITFLQQLTPAEYLTVYGVPVTSEPWWKAQRVQQVLPALFVPGFGSLAMINGDTGAITSASGTIPGVTGLNAFDANLDLAALTAATAAAAAQMGIGDASATVQAPVVDVVAGSVPAASSVPSGWRPGTDQHGASGYWGPDGLFYTGTAPWNDPTRQGATIESMAPPDVQADAAAIAAGGGAPAGAGAVVASATITPAVLGVVAVLGLGAWFFLRRKAA